LLLLAGEQLEEEEENGEARGVVLTGRTLKYQ
jgi:hypothetical protein